MELLEDAVADHRGIQRLHIVWSWSGQLMPKNRSCAAEGSKTAPCN